MAGLLSGLESLGLGSLENASIFEKKDSKSGGAGAKAEPPKVEEQDLIYERNFSCPVCSRNFTAKVMKTGKAKLKGMDFDLRPRYEGIAAEKYDVLLCPHCGYAAIARFFPNILSAQAKLIRENISENVVLGKYYDEIYSYEEALERYKLALACSVVKRGKASEKAYVCLKTAWVMRGYAEDLTEKGENDKALELFVPIYRVCKSTGQNGRILPNSILRPAIEAVTGIKLGAPRLPLAPATEEEMAVTTAILKEIGKL